MACFPTGCPIVMAFTALSYARMSAAFPLAGSAYAYTENQGHWEAR